MLADVGELKLWWKRGKTEIENHSQKIIFFKKELKTQTFSQNSILISYYPQDFIKKRIKVFTQNIFLLTFSIY